MLLIMVMMLVSHIEGEVVGVILGLEGRVIVTLRHHGTV